MRESVQRASVKDIVSVEWSLWIFRISFTSFERLLAALRIRSKTPTANCVPATLKNELKVMQVMIESNDHYQK